MNSATKTVWISVEYRLAPEYKYPIWLDDSSDVAQYIIQNKTSYGLILCRLSVYINDLICLGVNADAKIGVAGDSAGGMIAASLARSVKGIDFQVRIHPNISKFHQIDFYI